MSAIPQISQPSASTQSHQHSNRSHNLEWYAKIHEAAKNGLEFIPFLQQDPDMQVRIYSLVHESGKFNEKEQARYEVLFLAAQRDAFILGDVFLTEQDINLLNKIKKKVLKELNHDVPDASAHSYDTGCQDGQIAAPVPHHILSDDEFVGSAWAAADGCFSDRSSCARSVDLTTPSPMQIRHAVT